MGIRKEGSTSASFLLCLRRAVDMILEGIPVAYMGCKGVQKGDKEIRSITESRWDSDTAMGQRRLNPYRDFVR